MKNCEESREFYTPLFKQSLSNPAYLVLAYEDLASNAQAVFDKLVFPFLNKPSTPVRSRSVKQNTQPLRKVIENYKEIEAFIYHPLTQLEHEPVERIAVHAA